MKRRTIITYKDDIYELPHEQPSDLELRVLENYDILGKSQKLIER